MFEILLKCRQFVVYSFLFSFIINILLLTPMLFMITAMDRVLSSRSLETLFSLMAIAIFALLIEAFLENIRAKLLSRFSLTLHRLLGLPALKKILDIKHEDGQIRHGMEDIDILQNFITTKGMSALFDLPWVPFYLILLYLFHPLLAFVATVVMLILLLLTFWEYQATHNNQLQVSSFSRATRDFLELAYRNNEVISAMNMQENVAKRWWIINEDFLNRKNSIENKLALIQGCTRFLNTNVTIISLSVAAYFVIHDNLSAGIMIASSMLMGRALQPIGSIIAAAKSFIDAKGAYSRLNKLFTSQNTNDIALKLPAPQGQLSVERVFFF